MAQTLRVNVKGKWYTVEVGSLLERPVSTLVDGEPFDIDIESIPPQAEDQAEPGSAPAPGVDRPAGQRAHRAKAPTHARKGISLAHARCHNLGRRERRR